MIKAIIFDFGGPIVEWKEGSRAVYKKHEMHRNLERDTLHALFEPYIKGAAVGDFHSISDFVEKTKPSISLTIAEINEIFDEANEAMYVRPEMIEYIQELKKKYKIALLSNFTVGLQKFLQEVFKIYHFFDVVVSSYDVKMRKPDPQIYEHTLDKLDIQPDEAVFVDDLEENVEAAVKLGIHGIIFENSEQCKKDLEIILNS